MGQQRDRSLDVMPIAHCHRYTVEALSLPSPTAAHLTYVDNTGLHIFTSAYPLCFPISHSIYSRLLVTILNSYLSTPYLPQDTPNLDSNQFSIQFVLHI